MQWNEKLKLCHMNANVHRSISMAWKPRKYIFVHDVSIGEEM